MKTILLGALCVLAAVPALAQPEMTTGSTAAPSPPASMSCDDEMTNAELKLQTVIDQDKKEMAMQHMKAAENAIDRNDPVTCKAEVQKALDAVN